MMKTTQAAVLLSALLSGAAFANTESEIQRLDQKITQETKARNDDVTELKRLINENKTNIAENTRENNAQNTAREHNITELKRLIQDNRYSIDENTRLVKDVIEKHNQAGEVFNELVKHVDGNFGKVDEAFKTTENHLNDLDAKKADKTEVSALQDKVKQAFTMLRDRLPEEFDAKADKVEFDKLKERVDNLPNAENLAPVKQDIQDLKNNKADKAFVDQLAAAHDAAGKQFEGFVKHVGDGFDTVVNHLNTLNDEKADKTVVNDLIAAHNKAGEEIGKFVKHVNDSFDKVGEAFKTTEKHLNDLDAKKADKTALDAKADKTYVEEFETATIKNFEGLKGEVDANAANINALIDDLYGKEDGSAEGLFATVEKKADKADLDTKADKARVEELAAAHNKAGEEIGKFVNHVNDSFDKVGEAFKTTEKHLNDLDAKKADKTALDAKANVTELAALEEKTKQAFIETAKEFDKKADKASVENVKKQVANVAVATYRLDRDIQQTQEAVVGNAEAIANQAEAIIDLAEKKADKAALDTKADKARVEELAAAHNKAGEEIGKFVNHVNDSFDKVGEAFKTTEKHLNDLDAKKADKTALDAKADKAFVDQLAAAHDAAGKQFEGFVKHVGDSFDTVVNHLNTLNDEKADKTVVNDLIASHNKAGEEIGKFVDHVNDSFDKVGEAFKTTEKHLNDLDAKKADKTSVENVKKQVANVAVATYRLDRDLEKTQEAVAGNAALIANQAEALIDLAENKADKTSVENVKKQVANVAVATYRLDRDLTSLAEKTKQAFIETAAELDTKADKTSVENVKKQVANVAVATYRLDRDLTKTQKAVADLAETKADKAFVDAELAKKADKAFVDTELAKKADKAFVDTELAKKADKAFVDTELAKKADQAFVDAELAKKANQSAVDELNTQLNATNASVAAVKKDVAANAARIDGVENRVNSLESDMKHGFAAQAALAGLFQPYNIGKVNVTAAVGGYKSRAALAVGAGYRHNENFAVKGGVAISNKGGAAYQVGVNYEF